MAQVKGHSAAEILAHNAEALRSLQRSLLLGQGQFSLVIARCNYTRLRGYLLEALQKQPLAEGVAAPQVVDLPADTETLRVVIRNQMGLDQAPTAVLITGLEALTHLSQVLAAANQARDSFRQDFSFPVVLWANDTVLHHLSRFAPDLKTFAGPPIRFEYPPGELLHSLYKEAHHLFRRVLDQGSDRLLPNSALNLETGSRLRNELEFALSDLSASGETLDEELQASLDFVQARDAHANREMETASELYQRSLQFWEQQVGEQGCSGAAGQKRWEEAIGQKWRSAVHAHIPKHPVPTPRERQGCLLFHLGLWWRSYAVLQWSTYQSSCEQARRYFLQSLTVFQEAERLDLVARFVPAFEEVLQKLKEWEELQDVALAALELHHVYPDPVRQARDRGFLAEVALAQNDWPTVMLEATHALEILHRTESPEELDWVTLSQRGWYRFLLGEAQAHVGEAEQAIANLEMARQDTDAKYDLTLYLRILESLRDRYSEQGDYLKAFYVKRDRDLVENRFGLRAFVGAGQVQPWQPLSPALEASSAEILAADAITASGRAQDVQRLLERIERDDYKLTIIHGPSGVGKSSVINAGLLPKLLQQKFLKARRLLPVILSRYVNWAEDLENAIAKQVENPDAYSGGSSDPLTGLEFSQSHQDQETGTGTAPNLAQIRTAIKQNYFIILVFDQFEEFFFNWPSPGERRDWWEFFTDCLNLPFVKLVLSLREDYLHYLLECERLIQKSRLEIINDDILSSNVRYYLGNFSPEDTKVVIQALTSRAQFHLSEALIDALVADLSAELHQVRPIELQVVGAELQRENITTLEQYRALGEEPKSILVERFLHQAMEDCGPENAPLAELLLYFLTDEKRIRPLRTRSELALDFDALGLEVTGDELDLVLEILVGSGLIFEVPDLPEHRYQLVHDYLVDYIRQQQTPSLLEELREARELQELTEAQLREALIERETALEKEQQERLRAETAVAESTTALEELNRARQREKVALEERNEALQREKFALEKLSQVLEGDKAALKKELGASGVIIFGLAIALLLLLLV